MEIFFLWCLWYIVRAVLMDVRSTFTASNSSAASRESAEACDPVEDFLSTLTVTNSLGTSSSSSSALMLSSP